MREKKNLTDRKKIEIYPELDGWCCVTFPSGRKLDVWFDPDDKFFKTLLEDSDVVSECEASS